MWKDQEIYLVYLIYLSSVCYLLIVEVDLQYAIAKTCISALEQSQLTKHNETGSLDTGFHCLQGQYTSRLRLTDFYKQSEGRFHFCFFVCILPSYNLFFLCICVICVKMYPEYEIKTMMTSLKWLEVEQTGMTFGTRWILLRHTWGTSNTYQYQWPFWGHLVELFSKNGLQLENGWP